MKDLIKEIEEFEEDFHHLSDRERTTRISRLLQKIKEELKHLKSTQAMMKKN